MDRPECDTPLVFFSVPFVSLSLVSFYFIPLFLELAYSNGALEPI
jgi:hypothetical protein